MVAIHGDNLVRSVKMCEQVSVRDSASACGERPHFSPFFLATWLVRNAGYSFGIDRKKVTEIEFLLFTLSLLLIYGSYPCVGMLLLSVRCEVGTVTELT